VVATVHPSVILRAPEDDARHRLSAEFVRDLKAVRELIETRYRWMSAAMAPVVSRHPKRHTAG
jgi:hypothetical protein